MRGALASFAALDALPGIAAHLVEKIPRLDVALGKNEAMALLAPYQQQILRNNGLGSYPLITAEQVHGNQVAVIDAPRSLPIPETDGIATSTKGLTLGVSVADCAPVWIVSRDGKAGALLHSGKKGTALGILSVGVKALLSLGNFTPSDFLVLIGPCIRPPCYDMDFAAEIRRQAEEAGITDVHDTLVCTACHPERYYSYRREQGLTGRMLATLTLLPR